MTFFSMLLESFKLHMPRSFDGRSRSLYLIVAAAICGYYLWNVQAAGEGFRWGQDLDGYYDYLGRALAGGHVDLAPSVSLDGIGDRGPVR